MKRLSVVLGVVLALTGVIPFASAHAEDSTAPPSTLLPVDGQTGPPDSVAVEETPGQPTVTGPSVTVEPNVVNPGDRALITVSGFKAHLVTISVCGNEARRGSADCIMDKSQGLGLTAGHPSGIWMVIYEPVPTCPCVIRVTSDGNDEIASAPITITGHPVGALVDPPSFGDLIAVSIHATEAPGSFWGYFRSDLGGRTAYDVTVSVKNLTTTTMRNLRVSAAVGHGDSDYLGDITFGVPGSLPSGQTWQQTVRTVAKAPAYGSLKWRAAVSGAGPTMTAYYDMEHRPVLLMITCLAAILGVFILIIRALVRRHIRLELARTDAETGDQLGAPIAADADLVSVGGG
ncbi:MAG: hypothetical protein WCK21_00755 [Actinomycetota bacterium]